MASVSIQPRRGSEGNQKLQVPYLLQPLRYMDSFPGPRLIKPEAATEISRPSDG